jgi:branched-subunit amino acid transport protein
VSLVAILAIAAGSYAFRVAGPLLRDRVELPERVRALLSAAALVLLVALIATASLLAGRHFAGVALPAGVLVGGVLAWRKAPFVVVVVAAAACTAGLRLAGMTG